MNNQTATPYKRRYQGSYNAVVPEVRPAVPSHPIKAEIAKHIGTFAFVATFEEDREANDAFNNEAVIAYKCTLTHNNKVIGIGRGLNCLSGDNRYIGKSVRWAHSGALIDAVSRATKLPQLSGENMPDFSVGNIASEFMATDKQKSYLRELIDMNVIDEDEREQMLSNLDSMSKEDASEVIQKLKS